MQCLLHSVVTMINGRAQANDSMKACISFLFASFINYFICCGELISLTLAIAIVPPLQQYTIAVVWMS
uniref:Uncharacterized protein n=1 Tax=Arundo donax TaxID=35708 RepID=A0A0A9C9B5_ARUDO